LVNREKTAPKERKVNLKSPGHMMLVIADITDMIGITSSREISDCLKALGEEVSRTVLRKYLFLLEKLRLVKKLDYANQVYYVSRGRGPFIRYYFREETDVRDRDRAKALIRQGLSQSDQRRAKIYTNHFKRTMPKGESEYV
jgi:hypothetical protein